MLGTEKLTAAVMLTIALFNQGKKSFADGVQPKDFFDFIDELVMIQPAIESAQEILDELNDLDHTEREALENAVATKLDVSDVRAKEIVVLALDTVLSGYRLARAIV